MRIKLSADHRDHCEQLGLREIPREIDVEESRFHELCDHWTETLKTAFGEVNRDLLHTKVIGHLVSEMKVGTDLPFVPVEPTMREVVKHLKVIILLAVLILLSSVKGHCQFSRISSISYQNNGTPTTGGFFTYPFVVNCAGTLACTASGNTITLTGGGGGGGGYTTFQNGGSNLTQRAIANFANGLSCVDNAGSLRTDCQLATVAAISHKFFSAVTSGALVASQPASTDLGDFSTTAPTTSGKIPIYDSTAPNAAGGTGAYVPGDPLVQGTQAAGSTTLPNPVGIGGSDYQGSPALRALKVDSSGNASVTPTATPNPSNLDVATSTLAKESGGNLAAMNAKIPASPSTDRITAAGPFSTELSDGAAFYVGAKTGQLPAALDASGGVKTHEQGTVPVTAASLPAPQSITATGTITSNQTVQVTSSAAQTVLVIVSGTWTGTLQPQVSVDGTNFSNVGVIPFAPTGSSVSTITANGNYFLVVGGASKFQILGNTVASGTATVSLAASPAGFAQLAIQSTAANLNAQVRTQDGSGNALTSNSTTYAAKFGLDINLLGTLGTAFSTPGKIDVKGADGDLFVRSSTAANFLATVSQGGTWSLRAQDGAGNALTSNSTTYAAKFALDQNLLGTLGTAFSTPGKVDVKAADGDVFVRSPTATNFKAEVVGTGSDNGAANSTTQVSALTGVAVATPAAAKTAGRGVSMESDLHGTHVTGTLPIDFPSYTYNKLGLVVAASATDIAVISGNASNTVLITKVSVTCTETTAGIIDLALIKRSSADTAGTSTSITAIPLDSANAAATSAMLVYTANPTTGSPVGTTVDSAKLACLAPATATPADIYVWKPGIGQAIVLRGTAQQLAVNLNGVTVTGGNFNITIQTMELTNY